MNETAAVFENRQFAGVEAIVCRRLEDAGFLNAFSTRRGGVSPMPERDMNLTFGTDEPANVEENRRRFIRAAGLPSWPIITARQTHSAIVREVNEPYAPENEADAIFTKRPAALLGVKTADCLPILLADSKSGLTAAVHAGWRGLTLGVVTNAARAIVAAGAQPDDLIAALGPAACGRCLEVGSDVAESCHAADLDGAVSQRGDRIFVDLAEGAAVQLMRSGVLPSRIHRAGRCTIHETGIFFSHRRESPAGRPVGRLLSVTGRRPK